MSESSGPCRFVIVDAELVDLMGRGPSQFDVWLVPAREVRWFHWQRQYPGATLMLGEASRVLTLTPDAIVLEEWIAETARSIEVVSASAIRDLTPAELHILQYLPTHLSFPQIAGQVFVSPNTVKTQAQSVYRKLGVTSRREAVEQARAAGLLDPDGPESDTAQR